MPMTLVEKILSRATGQSALKAGDVVEPRVNLECRMKMGPS